MINGISFENNTDLYNIYMENWEAHRTNYGNISLIHFDYIIKSLALFFVCIFGIKYLSDKINVNCKLMLIAVTLSIFTSTIIYFAYKYFYVFFPDFLISIMPARFILIHSVIGIPIIISFFFIFLKTLFLKIKISETHSFHLVLLILFLYSVSHYKNVLIRTEHFFINLHKVHEININRSDFWSKVKNTKIEGLVLTSPTTTDLTFRKGLKPILLDPNKIDFIPYLPYTVHNVKRIVENVYKVSFNNPPLKNMAMIPNDIIKKNFEELTRKEWLIISNKFNVDALIVPKAWNIDLEKLFENSNHVFYKLVDKSII